MEGGHPRRNDDVRQWHLPVALVVPVRRRSGARHRRDRHLRREGGIAIVAADELLRPLETSFLSVRFVLAIAALVAMPAARGLAQRPDSRVDIVVDPANALIEGPTIASENLLGTAKTREHLRNGFPARVH